LVERDFPGGPVAKTSRFHCRGASVQSLARELDPTCHYEDQRSPHAATKTQNRQISKYILKWLKW